MKKKVKDLAYGDIFFDDDLNANMVERNEKMPFGDPKRRIYFVTPKRNRLSLVMDEEKEVETRETQKHKEAQPKR